MGKCGGRMGLSLKASAAFALRPLSWEFQGVVLTEVHPGQCLIKPCFKFDSELWNWFFSWGNLRIKTISTNGALHV